MECLIWHIISWRFLPIEYNCSCINYNTYIHSLHQSSVVLEEERLIEATSCATYQQIYRIFCTCIYPLLCKLTTSVHSLYHYIYATLLSYIVGNIEDFPFSDYALEYRGSEDPLVNGIVAYADPKHLISFFSDLLKYFNNSTSS